jgi:hypothetical protein
MNMFNDAQSALNFVVAQGAIIEPQVYRIQYPQILYPTLVPVVTDGDEWAKAVIFFSLDRVGQATWFNHMADDVPFADVVRSQYQVGLEMAAIGYYWTIEEVANAQRTNINLQIERAAAAVRASEEFIERISFFGDTTKSWTGLTNDPNVTIVPATADGTGSSALWSTKTGDQIIRDVNQILTGVYVGSQTVEMADTLLVSPANFTTMATTRLTNTVASALGWLQEYNSFSALTNGALTVKAVRGLETAGAGGVSRAVAYRNDPQILRLHLPMPHKFLSPMQVTPLRYDIPGIFRTGGIEIRRPGSVRYLDGI